MRRQAAGPASSPLWAITAYFNPAGFRRRLGCYREFRRRLAAPLVTVELSFGEAFELAPGDADVLVQLRGGPESVMWQKERLLNLAWAQVPKSCTKIAWLDCDVFFESDDWIQLADELLDQYPAAILFSRVGELRQGTPMGVRPDLNDCNVGQSLLASRSPGDLPEGVLHSDIRMARRHSGLAWAACREAFEGLGFYDACVMGSGNRAMLCAELGRFDDAVTYLRMGAAWAEHYRAWAESHYRRVQGRVGCLDTTIFHLWHGDLTHRRYAERHRQFSLYGFDPGRDIGVSDHGVWRWMSAKPEMHAFVRRYFEERQEDG